MRTAFAGCGREATEVKHSLGRVANSQMKRMNLQGFLTFLVVLHIGIWNVAKNPLNSLQVTHFCSLRGDVRK